MEGPRAATWKYYVVCGAPAVCCMRVQSNILGLKLYTLVKCNIYSSCCSNLRKEGGLNCSGMVHSIELKTHYYIYIYNKVGCGLKTATAVAATALQLCEVPLFPLSSNSQCLTQAKRRGCFSTYCNFLRPNIMCSSFTGAIERPLVLRTQKNYCLLFPLAAPSFHNFAS